MYVERRSVTCNTNIVLCPPVSHRYYLLVGEDTLCGVYTGQTSHYFQKFGFEVEQSFLVYGDLGGGSGRLDHSLRPY